MVAGRSEGRAIITRLEAGSRALVLGQDGVQGYADLAELQPVELPKRHLYKKQVWCEDMGCPMLRILSVSLVQNYSKVKELTNTASEITIPREDRIKHRIVPGAMVKAAQGFN